MTLTKYKYILFAILLSLLFAIGASLRFSLNHEQLPQDCDEFGYLNMAKAFSNGIAFKDHTSRPYFDGLIDELKNNNIPELEYRWMVIPHAYHFSKKTNYKVINQYPPGTSYVLSWIPIDIRKNSFPFITVFLSFLLPFLIGLYSFPKTNPVNILFPLSLLMVLMSISVPFLDELARVNSLALTFCLFISAGMLAKTKPHISVFLIVLSASFRVVNLLMLAPLLFIVLPDIIESLKTKNYKVLKSLILKYVVVLTIGILPYITYMVLLLNNPLLPTHPSHDTALHGMEGFINNFTFYFNVNQPWFNVHLILILILFIQLKYKLLSLKEFLIWISFPFINYSFFVFHQIQMGYYPFASAMILIGAIIYNIRGLNFPKLNKYLFIVSLLFGLAMSADGINRYFGKEHIDFNEANNYFSKLCEYDIVWGEMQSGTSEYSCNNSGFKYAFGTPKARKTAVKYLRDNGYSQVLLLNDISVSIEEIKQDLNSSSIEFEVINSTNLGHLLIIK